MIDITESIQPLLALLCPALGSILILIYGKRPNVREAWTLLASCLQFLIVLSMVPTILDGKKVVCYLFTMFPGIEFGFHVDGEPGLFEDLNALRREAIADKNSHKREVTGPDVVCG